jgi:hypothetical protein
MLKKMMGKLFTGMMRRQMETFLTRLEGMDGDEVGGVVLMALDISSQFKKTTSADLFEPAICVENNASLIVQLSARAEKMEREGQPMLAVGLAVWVHTLRAMTEGDLRGLGRQVWGELERGFPHVEQAKDDMLKTIGLDIDLSDFGKFPTGLTPQPLA